MTVFMTCLPPFLGYNFITIVLQQVKLAAAYLLVNAIFWPKVAYIMEIIGQKGRPIFPISRWKKYYVESGV